MKKEKLLSLCIITLNDEEYLADCVQTMNQIVDEVIIVDIGSTDGTLTVARELNASVYSVLWENDFSKAKNFCMEKAQGEWILFLQPNERISSKHFSEIHKLLDNPNVEAYLFYMNYVLANYSLYSPVQSLRLLRNRKQYRYEYPTFERVPDALLTNIEDVDIQIENCSLSMPWDLQLRIQLLHQEINSYPNDSYLQYMYGIVLLNSQAFDESICYFENAYRRVNRGSFYSPHLYKCLAWNYLILQQQDEALLILNEGIQHYPYYTDFYVLRGEVYSQRNQFEEAISDLKTCIDTRERPNFLVPAPDIGVEVASESLARLYESTFHYEKALNYYLKAYAEKNNNQELLYKVYALSKLTKNVGLLQRFHNQTMVIDEAFEDYAFEVARLCVAQNNLEKICEIYRNIFDRQQQDEFKNRMIGDMLYQNQVDMVLQFISSEQVELTKEAELILWIKQQVNKLNKQIEALQVDVMPTKSMQQYKPSEALLAFYDNLVGVATHDTALTSDQIHMEIGKYYEEKSRTLTALIAYLNALQCNPIDFSIQEKVIHYAKQYPQLLEEYCKDNDGVIENDWFTSKQDFNYFVLGITAFYERKFDQARTLLQVITKNEINQSLIEAYITSSRWLEGKELVKTDLKITDTFVMILFSVTIQNFINILNEGIKQYPFYGLLKSEAKKLNNLIM